MLFVYASGIQLFHSTNKKPCHPTSPISVFKSEGKTGSKELDMG